MKKIFFAAAIIVCAAACQRAMAPANTVMNQEITNANGQVILAGKATPYAMQLPNHKTWFDQSYNSYTIDSVSARQIKSISRSKTMEIFLGSWCGDSRREVPRMLKILQYAGIDTGKLSIVFVDNSPKTYKQSPQHEESGKYIHRVPTFIVYDGKNEIGRIVESPVVSLEKDLLAILQQSGYEPNYTAVAWWRKQAGLHNKEVDEAALQAFVAQVKPLVRNAGELGAFANVLLVAGNHTEAINVFRLNTLLYPDNTATFNGLAEALAYSNRKKEAVAVFEKLLVMKPADDNIRKRIAELKM